MYECSLSLLVADCLFFFLRLFNVQQFVPDSIVPVVVFLCLSSLSLSLSPLSRSIAQREISLSQSLIDLCEQQRARDTEIELRDKQTKAKQHAEEAGRKQAKEIAEALAKEREDGEEDGGGTGAGESGEEKERSAANFLSLSSPKHVNSGPLPEIIDPLEILSGGDGGGGSGGNDEDENEWRWSALVLLHQQQRKFEEENKEYEKMKEMYKRQKKEVKVHVHEPAATPAPAPATPMPPPNSTMQRLDTEGLAAWHSAVDTSEHYNRPAPPPDLDATEMMMSEDSMKMNETTKSKKIKNKKQTKTQKRRFSCIRNCRYQEDGVSHSSSIPWTLLESLLPESGTMTFDFVASPTTVVETSGALPHASHVDLLDCMKRIKKYVLLPADVLAERKRQKEEEKREGLYANATRNKKKKKEEDEGEERKKDPHNAHGHSHSHSHHHQRKKKKSDSKKKTHRNHPEHRQQFDELIHYLSTIDHSLTAVQASQLTRLLTSKSMKRLTTPWARAPEVVAAVMVKLFGMVMYLSFSPLPL